MLKQEMVSVPEAVTNLCAETLVDGALHAALYWSPEGLPPLHMIGSPFRIRIWEMMLQIPYGQTMTYGELAAQIAKERGIERMSAQAVGGAVAHNPISILVPCHRMVGTNGSLTGYAGGIPRKVELLKLEGVAVENLFVL